MMKKTNLFFISLILGLVQAQAPANYYTNAQGKTGYELKTALAIIIDNGNSNNGQDYGDLWTIYRTSSVDKYYERDGSVLDLYSEIPSGPDAYEYTFGTNQCGSSNQNIEGFCYNREHTLPATYFGGRTNTPMGDDAHFVIPTDYFVNFKRSDLSYGETISPTWISTNGSKLGNNNIPGYSGEIFEPINEFKGDIARMQLYFVTRYQSKLNSFNNSSTANPLDGSTNQGFKTWFLNLMLKWSAQDPVSQSEIDRNNAIYAKQKNRNPFIDNPQWVTAIWGSSPLSVDDSNFSKNLTIAPNPVKGNIINVKGDNLKSYKKAIIYNMLGQNIQTIDNPFENENTIIIKNLPKGIYILKTGELNTKFVIE